MKLASIISNFLLLLSIFLIGSLIISGRSAYNFFAGEKLKESISPPGNFQFSKNSLTNNIPTLLAIFAHPDDELLIGATLAHYASEGAKVYVAIATDGALGTTDFSNIPAGKQLAEARHAEMICSARALGVEPIFIGLPDQLNAVKGQLPQQLDSLRRVIVSLMTNLHPDVVVTFGAEGWTGHPDHRLVGIITTEVFASRQWPENPQLFYSALPTGSINDSSWAKYLTVDSSYLTVRIPIAAEDYVKVRAAFNCHQTQYRERVRQKLPVFHEQIQDGVAMFRPFLQTGKIRNSLFKN